jgi:hypothetical protein
LIERHALNWIRRGSAKRRLVVSFLISLTLFLAWDFVSFVLPAPGRALHNLTADPGQFLFFTTMLFAFYGLPLWAILFLVLTLLRSKRA